MYHDDAQGLHPALSQETWCAGYLLTTDTSCGDSSATRHTSSSSSARHLSVTNRMATAHSWEGRNVRESQGSWAVQSTPGLGVGSSGCRWDGHKVLMRTGLSEWITACSQIWNRIKGANFTSNTSKEKGIQRLNQK